MCLIKESGQLISGRQSFVPAHIPTIFKTDYEVLGQDIKRGGWALVISHFIWLFGACGCMTYYSMCDVIREAIDPSLSFLSWNGISGCNTRLDSFWKGRWVSAADGNQAVNMISPSWAISSKREGNCCRQRLWGHMFAELKRTGGEISWGKNDPALYLHTLFEGIE